MSDRYYRPGLDKRLKPIIDAMGKAANRPPHRQLEVLTIEAAEQSDNPDVREALAAYKEGK